MTKDDAKMAYALVSLYCALYKQTYGKDITVNKYREKWAMNEVIECIGYARAKELLEYYFKTTRSGHPLSWFFFNFEKLDAVLIQLDKDKDYRKQMMLKTKQMVEEIDNER